VPLLHKSGTKPVVNLDVAGILTPRKTGGNQSNMPPPCIHDGPGIVIMHQINLLSVVDAF